MTLKAVLLLADHLWSSVLHAASAVLQLLIAMQAALLAWLQVQQIMVS